MKSMRSQWGLVWFGIGAMTLASGCVIKATTSDTGAGGATSSGSGSATTSSSGSGTTSSSGSTSATGSGSTTVTGSSSGGAGGSSSTSSGAGGSSGGSGGSGTGGWMDSGVRDASGDVWQDGGPGIDDCDKCLVMQCSKELEACLDDPACFSGDPQDPGQYEGVIACVEQKRTTQAVKRADLVDCGLVAVPGVGWPPDDMADTTTDLINCMATGQTMVPMNNSWANSTNINMAWAPNSCAKLACTSKVQ
jgi:hypothetical protein